MSEKKRKSVQIDEDLWQLVKELAEAEGRTLTTQLKILIEEGLAHKKEEEPTVDTSDWGRPLTARERVTFLQPIIEQLDDEDLLRLFQFCGMLWSIRSAKNN